MLRLAPRKYQEQIFSSIVNNGSTLVVLPTGLGKTLIALMLIDKFYKQGKQCFVLAPTKPLVEQHFSSILSRTDIPSDKVVMVTGAVPPKERKTLWDLPVIVSTPQTVANDIEKNIFEFKADLCVFDEAHRAVGEYAYTKIAEKAKQRNALLLGLTASPGSDRKKIKEIMDNLGIVNVELREKQDEDVKPYVQPTDIQWEKVELSPNLSKASKYLKQMTDEKIEFFQSWGIRGRFTSKAFLIGLRDKILKTESVKKYMLLSQYSYLFNLIHLLELVQTQGPKASLEYIDQLSKKKTKASTALFRDPRFTQAISLLKSGEKHPKLLKLIELIKKEPGQIIVFSQYVSQIQNISDELNFSGVSNSVFIGQRKGFTQKKQKEIIERFRKNEFKVLVSSSVGEEGLDIPSVDTVIFFEPIPSAIRSIQRRGRAGRMRSGRVIILLTKNTQDEAFYWSSQSKEKKMKKIVRDISEKNNTTLKFEKVFSKLPRKKPKKDEKKPPQAKLFDF
ncbi:DEAD/DEAH box helicase family protein [Candidatus Micrarchaeota archaeon]|nr:DEAD/DEAH box helicase family protein [Candidatus Micrarchaeota archaeon]